MFSVQKSVISWGGRSSVMEPLIGGGNQSDCRRGQRCYFARQHEAGDGGPGRVGTGAPSKNHKRRSRVIRSAHARPYHPKPVFFLGHFSHQCFCGEHESGDRVAFCSAVRSTLAGSTTPAFTGPRICPPETIVVRACLSKARFLALLTRGVDLGIWFALAQGAVDRQEGSSLMAI